MIRRWEKSFSNLSIDVNHSFFAPSVGGRGRFKKNVARRGSDFLLPGVRDKNLWDSFAWGKET